MSIYTKMRLAHAVHFIYFHLSVTAAVVVGFYFTFVMFTNYAKDTTAITNAAFAIAASIAGLSFSCARAIEGSHGSQGTKDRYTYAGERCFHAAVLWLVASVLKYALLSLQGQDSVFRQEWLLQGLKLGLGGMAGALFFLALLSAHTGIRVVNDLLCSRMTRYKDWDNWA